MKPIINEATARRIVAPTLVLNYPDADNTSTRPWILYLGTWHKLRRPGRSRVKPRKLVTYVCGVRLDKDKHSRIIEILSNNIPAIYSQNGTQARVRVVKEILDKIEPGLYKQLYGTYIVQPGMIKKNGRPTSAHRGIVGSKRGPDLKYMTINQVKNAWSTEKVPPSYRKALTPGTALPPELDIPSVPTLPPIEPPVETEPTDILPMPEPTPEPVPEPVLEPPPPEPEPIEEPEETTEEPADVKPNAKIAKKFKKPTSESRETEERTHSSPSRQRRGTVSSPRRR